jgi:prepilin-type N-terminal cleavage/methylation domain-containing protein
MERRMKLDCGQQSRGSQRGFSMIEMMVVIAIIMVIAAMAILQLQPALQQNRAAAAAAQVKSALRQGRETAIAARRTVQVQFFTGAPCQAGSACIVLTRLDPPANVPTVILTLPVEGSVQFMQFAGEPDTPDAFGNGAPIFFGGVANGPPTMEFQSDGSFTDGNGNVIVGTIFLGIPNFRSTAMAVTLLGGTGRTHSYRCPGTVACVY